MMRKVFSVALMATLACAFGLAQSANAGVTIDLQFQDQTTPTGITVTPGDGGGGPGCVFTGYYGASVATGRCMDVLITSTFPMISINAYVAYDTDNGLAAASFYEWRSIGVTFNMLGTPTKSCIQFDGVSDTANQIGNFDCQVPPPNLTTPLAAGTYRIGTIVWDTSATTLGTEAVSVVSVIVGAIINGNIVDYSSEVVMGSHILTIIPEPGTASLLGLGLVGLILAGRRRRA